MPIKSHGHTAGRSKGRRKVSTEFTTWAMMLNRCKNVNAPNYYRYGGRGITVCKRWEKFTNFLEDMGPKPKGYSLDRINNNGPYSESNCHWIPKALQQRNMRTNVILTFNGKTQCLTAWANELGLNVGTVFTRYYAGKSINEIFKK